MTRMKPAQQGVEEMIFYSIHGFDVETNCACLGRRVDTRGCGQRGDERLQGSAEVCWDLGFTLNLVGSH